MISRFVADCREIWLQNGEAFQLLRAPDTSAAWAEAVVEIAGERLLGAARAS